jgi:hypothetical protein
MEATFNNIYHSYRVHDDREYLYDDYSLRDPGYGRLIYLRYNDNWFTILEQIDCPYRIDGQREIIVKDYDLIRTIVKCDGFYAIELLKETLIWIDFLYDMIGEIVLNGSVELLRCFKQFYPDHKIGNTDTMVRICKRYDQNLEMLEFLLSDPYTDTIPMHGLYHAIRTDRLKIVKYLMDRYQVTLTFQISILIIRSFSKECFEYFVKDGSFQFNDETIKYLNNINIMNDRSKLFVRMIIKLGDAGLIPEIDTFLTTFEKQGYTIDELLNDE